MKDGDSDIKRLKDTIYVEFYKEIASGNERCAERDFLHGNHHPVPLIYSTNHFPL